MVPHIAEKDLQKGKAAFYQCGDVLAVKYRGAKDTSRGKPKTVCLLTTAHTTQMRILRSGGKCSTKTSLYFIIQYKDGWS